MQSTQPFGAMEVSKIQAATPWLDKIVICLDALSEDAPRNVTQVAKATKTSRNVVAAVLNACANFSLIEVSFDGRSERFVLTFKAAVYLRILKSELQPVVQCIEDILLDAKKREPKKEVNQEDHFMAMMRSEANGSLPAYFRLHAVADAFSLAGNRYFEGSLEHKVFCQISYMLKEGSSIFSGSKSQRAIGQAMIRRTIESLRAIRDSRNVAKEQQLDDLSAKSEKISRTRGGEAVFQVK